MTRQEFYSKIETMQEQPIGSVTGISRLDAIGWDSIGIVSFIALVDREFQTTIAADSINCCETVSELADLLSDKLIP